MLAGIFTRFTNSILEKYTEPITSKQTRLEVLKGITQFSNLVLKENAFLNQGIPLKVRKGIINTIYMQFSLTRLEKEPIIASIDGIYLVLELDWNFFKKKEIYTTASELTRKNKHAEAKLMEDIKSVLGLMDKIIDNLVVRISNLHVRIEITKDNRTDTLGIIMPSFLITTAENGNDPSGMLVSKYIGMDYFNIYFDLNSGQFDITNMVEMKKLMDTSRHSSLFDVRDMRATYQHYRDALTPITNSLEFFIESITGSISQEQLSSLLKTYDITLKIELQERFSKCNRPKNWENLEGAWIFVGNAAATMCEKKFDPRAALIFLKARKKFTQLYIQNANNKLNSYNQENFNRLSKSLPDNARALLLRYASIQNQKITSQMKETLTPEEQRELQKNAEVVMQTLKSLQVTAAIYKFSLALMDKKESLVQLDINETNSQIFMTEALKQFMVSTKSFTASINNDVVGSSMTNKNQQWVSFTLNVAEGISQASVVILPIKLRLTEKQIRKVAEILSPFQMPVQRTLPSQQEKVNVINTIKSFYEMKLYDITFTFNGLDGEYVYGKNDEYCLVIDIGKQNVTNSDKTRSNAQFFFMVNSNFNGIKINNTEILKPITMDFSFASTYDQINDGFISKVNLSLSEIEASLPLDALTAIIEMIPISNSPQPQVAKKPIKVDNNNNNNDILATKRYTDIKFELPLVKATLADKIVFSSEKIGGLFNETLDGSTLSEFSIGNTILYVKDDVVLFSMPKLSLTSTSWNFDLKIDGIFVNVSFQIEDLLRSLTDKVDMSKFNQSPQQITVERPNETKALVVNTIPLKLNANISKFNFKWFDKEWKEIILEIDIPQIDTVVSLETLLITCVLKPFAIKNMLNTDEMLIGVYLNNNPEFWNQPMKEISLPKVDKFNVNKRPTIFVETKQLNALYTHKFFEIFTPNLNKVLDMVPPIYVEMDNTMLIPIDLRIAIEQFAISIPDITTNVCLNELHLDWRTPKENCDVSIKMKDITINENNTLVSFVDNVAATAVLEKYNASLNAGKMELTLDPNILFGIINYMLKTPLMGVHVIQLVVSAPPGVISESEVKTDDIAIKVLPFDNTKNYLYLGLSVSHQYYITMTHAELSLHDMGLRGIEFNEVPIIQSLRAVVEIENEPTKYSAVMTIPQISAAYEDVNDILDLVKDWTSVPLELPAQPNQSQPIVQSEPESNQPLIEQQKKEEAQFPLIHLKFTEPLSVMLRHGKKLQRIDFAKCVLDDMQLESNNENNILTFIFKMNLSFEIKNGYTGFYDTVLENNTINVMVTKTKKNFDVMAITNPFRINIGYGSFKTLFKLIKQPKVPDSTRDPKYWIRSFSNEEVMVSYESDGKTNEMILPVSENLVLFDITENTLIKVLVGGNSIEFHPDDIIYPTQITKDTLVYLKPRRKGHVIEFANPVSVKNTVPFGIYVYASNGTQNMLIAKLEQYEKRCIPTHTNQLFFSIDQKTMTPIKIGKNYSTKEIKIGSTFCRLIQHNEMRSTQIYYISPSVIFENGLEDEIKFTVDGETIVLLKNGKKLASSISILQKRILISIGNESAFINMFDDRPQMALDYLFKVRRESETNPIKIVIYKPYIFYNKSDSPIAVNNHIIDPDSKLWISSTETKFQLRVLEGDLEFDVMDFNTRVLMFGDDISTPIRACINRCNGSLCRSIQITFTNIIISNELSVSISLVPNMNQDQLLRSDQGLYIFTPGESRPLRYVMPSLLFIFASFRFSPSPMVSLERCGIYQFKMFSKKKTMYVEMNVKPDGGVVFREIDPPIHIINKIDRAFEIEIDGKTETVQPNSTLETGLYDAFKHPFISINGTSVDLTEDVVEIDSETKATITHKKDFTEISISRQSLNAVRKIISFTMIVESIDVVFIDSRLRSIALLGVKNVRIALESRQHAMALNIGVDSFALEDVTQSYITQPFLMTENHGCVDIVAVLPFDFIHSHIIRFLSIRMQPIICNCESSFMIDCTENILSSIASPYLLEPEILPFALFPTSTDAPEMAQVSSDFTLKYFELSGLQFIISLFKDDRRRRLTSTMSYPSSLISRIPSLGRHEVSVPSIFASGFRGNPNILGANLLGEVAVGGVLAALDELGLLGSIVKSFGVVGKIQNALNYKFVAPDSVEIPNLGLMERIVPGKWLKSPVVDALAKKSPELIVRAIADPAPAEGGYRFEEGAVGRGRFPAVLNELLFVGKRKKAEHRLGLCIQANRINSFERAVSLAGVVCANSGLGNRVFFAGSGGLPGLTVVVTERATALIGARGQIITVVGHKEAETVSFRGLCSVIGKNGCISIKSPQAGAIALFVRQHSGAIVC